MSSEKSGFHGLSMIFGSICIAVFFLYCGVTLIQWGDIEEFGSQEWQILATLVGFLGLLFLSFSKKG